MLNVGYLNLRRRRFAVSSASISYHATATWSIDIHTHGRTYDGETWSPYLYHQGLTLPALTPESLVGLATAWNSLHDDAYPHPEFGLMSVFGHHDVYQCQLSFGGLFEKRIAVTWTGLCEVFWDERFQADVPFSCQCTAEFEYLHPEGYASPWCTR